MEIVPYDGQDWRCSQQRFDWSVERAKELENIGATDVRIWYDPKDDFMKTSFSLDGDVYEVRLYKVFAVRKNGDPDFMNKKIFNNGYDLINFFQVGKHKQWLKKMDDSVAIE